MRKRSARKRRAEAGPPLRSAEGESAIEHRRRVGPMYIAQVASNGRVLTWGAKVSYSET
ncbi:BnaA05g10390D [Brassica napus]|uniref:BnaA05g10390D protein n=1 Tax=Brassica napus TaxID=3708 RepID=A0A078FVM1_BRANA|nr:BnaA05g10390D [Brassica napus]